MATAMVLSAGFGTRLRPFTDELAKPLMPVGDRPMLAHVVEALARGGVRTVVVNTHHRATDFTWQLTSLGAAVQVVYEPRILGTAGGVANAARELGVGSDVIVWNGDTLAPDVDVAGLLGRRSLSGVDMLWVVEPAGPGEGTVGLDTAGNVVRLRGERFGQEASGGYFLGIQAMSGSFRSTLPHEGCLVADVALPFLRHGGQIRSLAFTAKWDEVGTAGSLLRANLRWLERNGLSSFCAPDAEVDGTARLTRSLVGSGARVIGSGPVFESVVFPGAELRAPASRTIAGRHSKAEVALESPPIRE